MSPSKTDGIVLPADNWTINRYHLNDNQKTFQTVAACAAQIKKVDSLVDLFSFGFDKKPLFETHLFAICNRSELS